MFSYEMESSDFITNRDNQTAATRWMSLMRNPQNKPGPDATWLAPGTLDTSAVQGASLVYIGGPARRCIHGIHLQVTVQAHTNY